MNDITKLPKWAQAKIERLQSNVAYAELRMANALGTRPTAIEIDTTRRYNDKLPRMYAAERAIIEFTIPGGTVDVSLRDGELHIMGHSRDHIDRMVVVPSSSNVVFIRFAPKPAPSAGE